MTGKPFMELAHETRECSHESLGGSVCENIGYQAGVKAAVIDRTEPLPAVPG